MPNAEKAPTPSLERNSSCTYSMCVVKLVASPALSVLRALTILRRRHAILRPRAAHHHAVVVDPTYLAPSHSAIAKASVTSLCPHVETAWRHFEFPSPCSASLESDPDLLSRSALPVVPSSVVTKNLLRCPQKEAAVRFACRPFDPNSLGSFGLVWDKELARA
jgi:hypothetical protein